MRPVQRQCRSDRNGPTKGALSTSANPRMRRTSSSRTVTLVAIQPPIDQPDLLWRVALDGRGGERLRRSGGCRRRLRHGARDRDRCDGERRNRTRDDHACCAAPSDATTRLIVIQHRRDTRREIVAARHGEQGPSRAGWFPLRHGYQQRGVIPCIVLAARRRRHTPARLRVAIVATRPRPADGTSTPRRPSSTGRASESPSVPRARARV